jgi:hypothetical protein
MLEEPTFSPYFNQLHWFPISFPSPFSYVRLWLTRYLLDIPIVVFWVRTSRSDVSNGLERLTNIEKERVICVFGIALFHLFLLRT